MIKLSSSDAANSTRQRMLRAGHTKADDPSHWNSDMMYFLDDLLPTPGHASRRTRQANESSTGLGSSASVDCESMVIYPAKSNHSPISILEIVAILQQDFAPRDRLDWAALASHPGLPLTLRKDREKNVDFNAAVQRSGVRD